jgi:integrase
MIKKRGNGYGVRVHRGGGTYDWIGTYPTRRQAKAAEALAISQPARAAAQTVGDYARVWLTDYQGRRKASSYERARHGVNAIEAHPLANEPIDDVDLAVADDFAHSHPSSVPTAITVLNAAIARGAAHTNPLRGKSRRSNGRRDLDPLTVDQVTNIADAAQTAHPGDFGTTMRALVGFSAYTGIRPGELFALEHTDIDRTNNRVWIRRRLHGGRLDLPKSNRIRQVALLPEAEAALEQLPRRADGLVFRAKRGGRMSAPLMSSNYWPPIRAAAAMPTLDLYELRHFCGHHLYVTLDLPSRVVAAQLGHASPRLVEDLYGHFKVGALDEIDRRVGRTGGHLRALPDANETHRTTGGAR